MARVIKTLNDYIDYLNVLFETDSSSPTSGEEDYTVWTDLANIAINLWENEEGVLWDELFVDVQATGSEVAADKVTTASTYEYVLPTDFKFPASGYVWLGSGDNKTAYQVIKPQDVQLLENDGSRWCYFDFNSKKLCFNPNLQFNGGENINYRYYKFATKLSSGSDEFEMSDPMFAVYYALSELKKDEGDTSAGVIATQKLEAMKTMNMSGAWYQDDSFKSNIQEGFGT